MKDDMRQAFPAAVGYNENTGILEPYLGMTIREYAAIHICANNTGSNDYHRNGVWAVRQADALLEALKSE